MVFGWDGTLMGDLACTGFRPVSGAGRSESAASMNGMPLPVIRGLQRAHLLRYSVKGGEWASEPEHGKTWSSAPPRPTWRCRHLRLSLGPTLQAAALDKNNQSYSPGSNFPNAPAFQSLSYASTPVPPSAARLRGGCDEPVARAPWRQP